VTDPATRNKIAVQSRFMLADLAVVDPELMRSVLSQITAETGVDAMAHCVEAFTNIKAHPIIDHYALEGARLVGRYLSGRSRTAMTPRRAPVSPWPRSMAAFVSGRSIPRVVTPSPIRSGRGTRSHTALRMP